MEPKGLPNSVSDSIISDVVSVWDAKQFPLSISSQWPPILYLLFITECTKDSNEKLLAYPTMCVSEQETGHGRCAVVYPSIELKVLKVPYEDEHSLFTRLVFYES